MTRDKYSRRTFLGSLGASLAILPLLDAERARAGCLAAPPKRAIFLVWPNSTLGWASGNETVFNLPESLAPWEELRSDILLVKGVRYQNLIDTPNPEDNDNAGHGTPSGLLSGTRYSVNVPFRQEAGGPTIDQHIANELKKQGKFGGRTLHLGIRHEGYQFVYRSAGQPVPPDNDPYHAFDALFAGAATGTAPDPAIERLRLTRRSVLDHVRGDLDRFCKNLGSADRARCDAHLTSVRELEQTLQGGAIAAGCVAPNLGGRLDTNANESIPTLFKAQVDLMVAAMAADIVRTGVISFGNEANNHIIPTWLGFAKTGQDTGTGDSNSHHSIAHAAGDDPGSANGKRKVAVDNWLHGQAAYLAKRLKGEVEAGSNMLASSVVVCTNNMDNGAGHGIHGVPWLLAGQLGGTLKTGRNLNPGDVPHTDILNVIADGFDVSVDGYTNPEYRGRFSALRG